MNYIVMDLEWNQGSTGREPEADRLPFEIVEIGAVKLDASRQVIDEFQCLIKPTVYKRFHEITGRLIHLTMEDLEAGCGFVEAAKAFFAWCGEEEAVFCTWGNQDLTELQRNMDYHGMEPLSRGPLAFLDVQKLFALAFEEKKARRSLEYAVDYMDIQADRPYHRAASDAYYTGAVLERIPMEYEKNISYDIYSPPADREGEIKIQFDSYMKYISRTFPTREEAFADREVASSKCYLCRRNLRKKLKWFTVNNKHYYCLAYCEKHGYLKGKIRVKKDREGRIFVVKTTKLISGEEAEMLRKRKENLKRKKAIRLKEIKHAGH